MRNRVLNAQCIWSPLHRTRNYMNFNPHGEREIFQEFHYGEPLPRSAVEFIRLQTISLKTHFELYWSFCKRKLLLLFRHLRKQKWKPQSVSLSSCCYYCLFFIIFQNSREFHSEFSFQCLMKLIKTYLLCWVIICNFLQHPSSLILL